MPSHKVIVVGASAGGVAVLMRLVKLLPRNLNAAILIVMHLSAHNRSLLREILAKESQLPVVTPQDGTKLLNKHIYVAPPNFHMLVKLNKIHLISGPTVNHARPSIDPLFHSAAVVYGSRTIGIICSGLLDDGSAGLAVIKNYGGTTIAQDPKEAEHPDMPKNAIELGVVDYILPLSEIAKLIIQLSKQISAKSKKTTLKNPLNTQTIGGRISMILTGDLDKLGKVSTLTCPDCHGALWEIEDDRIVRFRCRTGHAYGIESLLAAHTDSLESTLWAAVRALEENATISHRLAKHNTNLHHPRVTKHFKDRALISEKNASLLRELLVQNEVQTQNKKD